MSGNTVTGFDPLLFKHYQLLACAILKQYWKDKEREEEKLKRARTQMEERIKTGRSKGLIHRWNPETAKQSFRQMEQNFENFCYWESTELYQFYIDLASCRLSVVDERTNPNEIKGKKIC